MRAAAHHVGTAHHRQQTALARGLGGRQRGRELGHAGAFGMRLLHMGDGGVVVAGERDAVFAAVVHEVVAVRLGVLGLQALSVRHLVLELFLAPAFLAGVVDPRVFQVFPLALARRVVHQRDQRQAFMPVEGLEQVDGVVRRQLAAHVQVVVGAQHVFGGTGVQRLQHRVPRRATQAFVVGVAHTQRVKHGSDTGGGDLGVVRQQRRHLGPLHLGARHQVALEVVGVHLDEAGHEEVAFQVDGLRQRTVAGAEPGDATGLHRQAAGLHGVRQNQTGVLEHDGRVHGVAHGALLKSPTLMRRVATASPTWAS